MCTKPFTKPSQNLTKPLTKPSQTLRHLFTKRSQTIHKPNASPSLNLHTRITAPSQRLRKPFTILHEPFTNTSQHLRKPSTNPLPIIAWTLSWTFPKPSADSLFEDTHSANHPRTIREPSFSASEETQPPFALETLLPQRTIGTKHAQTNHPGEPYLYILVSGAYIQDANHLANHRVIFFIRMTMILAHRHISIWMSWSVWMSV